VGNVGVLRTGTQGYFLNVQIIGRAIGGIHIELELYYPLVSKIGHSFDFWLCLRKSALRIGTFS